MTALGLHRLRLDPDMFWRLTPRELLLIAGFGLAAPSHCDRAALARLLTDFPDDGG